MRGRDPAVLCTGRLFCTPRKQEHFLKLSLSFNGVQVEYQRCPGIYKHVFYFSVGMHLFFNAIRIEMGDSVIQRKMYLISYHYLKNPLQFLLNSV